MLQLYKTSQRVRILGVIHHAELTMERRLCPEAPIVDFDGTPYEGWQPRMNRTMLSSLAEVSNLRSQQHGVPG